VAVFLEDQVLSICDFQSSHTCHRRNQTSLWSNSRTSRKWGALS